MIVLAATAALWLTCLVFVIEQLRRHAAAGEGRERGERHEADPQEAQ